MPFYMCVIVSFAFKVTRDDLEAILRFLRIPSPDTTRADVRIKLRASKIMLEVKTIPSLSSINNRQ